MLVCALLCSLQIWAQNINLTGEVLGNSGEILPGASVMVKGNAPVGTTTDINGRFSISVKAGDVIEVSFVGYQTAERKVSASDRNLQFILDSDFTQLDEVVAVGYGVQKEKLLTGATNQVKGDEIAKMNTVSPIGALASQTSGVSIISNSGKPNAGYKVAIRSVGTMGDAAPIVVIDGLVGGISNLNALNPNDIRASTS